MDVLEIIHTVKEMNEWMSRMSEEELSNYRVLETPDDQYRGKIKEFKKMMRIGSSAWMNIPKFLETMRNRLRDSYSLLEEHFEHETLKIHEEHIQYGLITAKKIIFCEGYKSLMNPLWDWVPLVPAKGEILTIRCDELPEEFILLSGMFIIPVGEKKFRAGSTYEWNFPHEMPTEEGRLKLLHQLRGFLRVPFEIIDHKAGVRPTVKDRRPLIGSHPAYSHVYLFNGMGTKGVQLIPWFADHFINHLSDGIPLMNDVNLLRWSK
jgi:glycine/D-amino acid oxidase-like deaminating enzyme